MEWISAKNIIYTPKHTWFGCDYNMNIYQGCCHGCIYCDSRSECYHIEDYSKVRAKKDAMIIIEKNLRSKRKKGIVGMGAMSDPYNPFEKTHELTRQSLKLMDRYGFGVMLATKSDLVTRDIDILKRIQTHSPVLVCITITCVDDALSKKLEPHVCVSSERFKALQTLVQNGIPVCVLLMPVLPFITDDKDNIVSIIRKAANSGVKHIYPSFGVTLRQNQRDYYFRQLDELYIGLSEKYLRCFGDRYMCPAQDVKSLKATFERECLELDILYKHSDIIKSYQSAYSYQQLSWF